LVYITINHEIYNTDDRRIAFVLSFMTEGDAGAWKEELISRAIDDSLAKGIDITFGPFKEFNQSLNETFNPYDALGDALDEMKHL
jgi:hypothetical protein